MSLNKEIAEEHELVLSEYLAELNDLKNEIEEEGNDIESDNSYRDSETGYNLVEDVEFTKEYEELLDLIDEVNHLIDLVDEDFRPDEEQKEILRKAYQSYLSYLSELLKKKIDKSETEEDDVKIDNIIQRIYDSINLADWGGILTK